MKHQYSQTCSKAEQLTLALFMESGYYQTNIKKLRNLYSQKLAQTMQAFGENFSGDVIPINTQSGISLTLKIKSNKTADELCREAKSIGLQMVPISKITDDDSKSLIFYYSKLPLKLIESSIKNLLAIWNS
jgi:GntR family transcriptional regulator/MocR family aminotransferase